MSKPVTAFENIALYVAALAAAIIAIYGCLASAHAPCAIDQEYNVRNADGTIEEISLSDRSQATCTGKHQDVSIGDGKKMHAEIVLIPGRTEPLYVSRFAVKPTESRSTEVNQPTAEAPTPDTDDALTEAQATCVECAGLTYAPEPRPRLNRDIEDIQAQVEALSNRTPASEEGDTTMSSPIQNMVCHMDSRRFGCRMHPVLGYIRQHDGIDLNSNGHPFNKVVVSSMEGKVTTRQSGKLVVRHCESGKMIRDGRISNEPCEIRMADGTIKKYRTLESVYRHVFLKSGKAAMGSAVSAGEVIAEAGNIGLGTGIHLHYEVHGNGTPLNPLDFHKATEVCNFVERGEALYRKNSAGQCTRNVEAYL